MYSIETIQNLNHALAYAGLLGIILILILVIDYCREKYFTSLIARFGLQLAGVSVLFSVSFSLVYSELFGFVPCGLCWLERMALYPQLILISVALYIRDKTLMPIYGIVLSVFGLVISLYHHYIQMGGAELVKCPASSVDCAKRFFFEFDFMTFPLLSAIIFGFLIILYTYLRKSQ